ncbi:hypothetical protein SprV_0802517300 [Sparganum proliferum]
MRLSNASLYGYLQKPHSRRLKKDKGDNSSEDDCLVRRKDKPGAWDPNIEEGRVHRRPPDSGGKKRRPSDGQGLITDDFVASGSHSRLETAPYTAVDLAGRNPQSTSSLPLAGGGGRQDDDRDSQRTARIHRDLLNDLNEGTRLQAVPPKI